MRFLFGARSLGERAVAAASGRAPRAEAAPASMRLADMTDHGEWVRLRTQATDADSRRAFLRYWRALSPFIGVVLRAQLRAVANG